MSKQHNYDFNSVEEIIRSAQQTGLDHKEIANRLDLSYSDFLKWYLAFSSHTGIFSDRDGEPPKLAVSQERLDYLAEYCRTQGIFPIISSPESAESPQGRNNTFKEQMIISWKKFLKREYRHPTSAELINQLEQEAVPLSGIAVDKNLRKITINGHSRRYGGSSEPFEQSYRRLKKQMLDQ
ncbi:hypothetical protein N9K52_00690 [Litoricolaceae bacterium]|nr:hypothetical protein [Litorivicinaceae bacterium]